MAVYVEISKTKHLTYSPLNEKHNILYSRARTNVNQRHIQKPWFDLNPFLDREDHTAVSLERYRPEDDEGLLPLQSLVIVEDYSSDKPHYGKEFKIDEFWEHLFSKDWNNGYSLRVLEGRLQDLLITCLVTLIHGDRVTQHSTMAYAKNRRQRNSIYKPSQKKPELKPYEETLLLEFIYYGRVVKSNAHETEASSDGYPNVTTCSATTYVSSELETTDLDVAIFKEAYQPIPPASPLESSIHMRRHRLLCRRSTLDESDTNVTEVQVDSCVLQPIPRGSARQREYSSVYGTSSEDYRQLPPKINLENFACTEKVSYLGEFNLSDDSSGSDDEADNEDFGQQYYLGERKRVTPALTSTAEKLKQRKAIVVQERALKREQAQQNQVAPTRKSFMPEFSELDVAKYVRKSEMHINLEAHRRAEEAKVPELEEYVATLRKDERKKARMLKRMQRFQELSVRFTNVSSANERFADQVGGVTDSQACRLHCYNQKDTSWKLMSENSRRKFLLKKLADAGGKVHLKKQTKKHRAVKEVHQLQIPLIYITTVSGLTYLHPVSKQMLQKKRIEKIHTETQKSQAKANNPPRRRASLVPVAEDRRHSTSNKQPKSPVRIPVNKKFPKASIVVDEGSSSDSENDSEPDGLENSPFNTKKLNIRYSVEKIRKLKAKKKSLLETKKSENKDDVFDILRKYYRMQTVLKAFGRGRGGRRMSVFGGKTASKRIGRKSMTAQSGDTESTENREIGKLKWFKFLDPKKLKTTAITDGDIPLFENYPMDLFRSNLERALEEFVVRREVVISDYNAKVSVSITFTKKSVFSKPKSDV